MKALNLRIIEEQQMPLEAIVMIECDAKEDATQKMGKMNSEIVDTLTTYDGNEEHRGIETQIYGPKEFYVKIVGIPKYIWMVLRAVMERPEFRFTRTYSDYLARGVEWGMLRKNLLDEYEEDVRHYALLESGKKQAVAEERFEDAAIIKTKQDEMKKRVYVAD